MKNLLIIGARGYGREIYNFAIDSKGYGTEFTVKGYLDDKVSALDGFENYPPIIGPVESYEVQPDDVFICALGEVKYKIKYCQMILNKGGEFINLISNRAYIGMNVKMGNGCIVCPDARIHCDITIGNFVTIQPMAIIGHDVKIGDWSHINALADCGGASVLGEGVTLHTTSFICPKSVIGEYATVGAGSVVLRRVKAGDTVFGVPAKPILVPKIKK